MPIEVLIITGQTGYHSWHLNFKALQDTYQSHELFSPTVLISPAKGEDMSGFLPDFDANDVIVLDYEGDEWPVQTRSKFEDFVKEGSFIPYLGTCQKDQRRSCMVRDSGPFCYGVLNVLPQARSRKHQLLNYKVNYKT